MKIGLLSTGLLLLAACTTAKPAPVPPAPTSVAIVDAGAPLASDKPEGSLETKESKQVAKTLKRVSELRGLDSTKPVPGVKLQRSQLVGRIKDKALREFPPEALRREGDLLLLFGFAPATFDYLGEMLKLLDAQLEGFYEPNNGTMYLAADLKGKEAEATLAHELVHALQDQHYDLKKRSTYKPGKSDETLALACLAEGDATSLMMDYVMAADGHTALDLQNDTLRGMMSAGMEMGDLKDTPHILKSSLIAPYIDGLFFVHAARRQGGWAAVNTIWENPPTTTEQVLHYEKWQKHEAPIEVATPTGNALGAGWKLDDEDSMGELGFALTYEEWIAGPDARKAAADWGGDRSAIYTNGDQMAFAVHERFDPGAPKPAVWSKLLDGAKKFYGKAVIDNDMTVCFERSDFGPLMLTRKNREYVVIAGPTRRSGTTWTSTSTCAAAKTWAGNPRESMTNLEHWMPCPRPLGETIDGRYARLEKLSAAHAETLYAASQVTENYRWLFDSPPTDRDAFDGWLSAAAQKADPLFYAVIDKSTGHAEGRQAFLRITPEHGVIEIGSILWGPRIAKTRVATEALYLFAEWAFSHGYRRFEWKCDSENAPSRRAAERFGFTFEGIFRQHMVVKHRSRDTAWFAITDGEWPLLKSRFEQWLEPSNFDASGTQIRPLRG